MSRESSSNHLPTSQSASTPSFTSMCSHSQISAGTVRKYFHRPPQLSNPQSQPHRPQPMSCVAMSLEFLKLNHDPKARITGLHLTKSHAQWFHLTTTSLISILNQQISTIPLLHPDDPSFTRKLKAIQDRQFRFQNTMKLVLDAVRSSTELWLKELDDGQQAVLRKIKWCNRMSQPANLGTRDAALKYWPLIADSYNLILTNLERLEDELEDALDDDTLWTGRRSKPKPKSKARGKYKPKPNSKGKAVYFFKDLCARWIPGIEQGDEEGDEKKYADFVMPLTN